MREQESVGKGRTIRADRSFPAELVQKIRSRLVWRNGTQLASRVVHGVTDHVSSLRPLVELCVDPAPHPSQS